MLKGKKKLQENVNKKGKWGNKNRKEKSTFGLVGAVEKEGREISLSFWSHRSTNS